MDMQEAKWSCVAGVCWLRGVFGSVDHHCILSVFYKAHRSMFDLSSGEWNVRLGIVG
jgi:hypothetical protein